MIRRLLEINEKEERSPVCFSTAKQYFEDIRLKGEDKDLPTVDDELYVKSHRGTFTTEAMIKRQNRRCEVLLLTLERFLCIAKRYGLGYPKAKLNESWDKLLFNQVHDNIDGTSLESIYQEAATDYKDIESFVSGMGHLETIAKHIHTSGKDGKVVVVFNPLSWSRKSIAEIPMDQIAEKDFCIQDQNDLRIPHQVVRDREEEKVVFMAEVPALGYTVYRLVSNKNDPALETDLRFSEETLENTYFKVQVVPELNHAVTIFDKQNGKKVIDSTKGGNILEIYEDRPPQAPRGEPAWNIYPGNKLEPAAFKVYVVEEGPVRGKIRIERKFGHSKFVQDVVLYSGSPRIDFEVHIDWHENYRFGKVSFPFDFSSNYATYEIPYGVIQRYDHSLKKAPQEKLQFPQRGWENADKARWEVPSLKWVDVSSAASGYGVSLLNDSKYGFSFENNTLRMSLVRGARRPSAYNVESWTDQSDKPWVGLHQINYAVYPHKGDWRTADTVRKGYEYNYPLQVILDGSHDGKLPPQHSFIEVLPKNVILTAIKEAEDSEDFVIRMYESCGLNTTAEIKFDVEPSKVLQI
jgi:alpha-mannosidase